MENHIIKVFNNRARKYGDKEAYRFIEDGISPLSWNQLKNKVEMILSSLNALGIKKSENIGLYSPNRAEWMMADLGIMANACVSVPFYATASQDQIVYIAKETEMRLVFAGNTEMAEQLASFSSEIPRLEKIIVLEGYAGSHEMIMGFDAFLGLGKSANTVMHLEECVEHYDGDDIATIIYTSGTTGEPKGVVLNHSNFIHCFDIHDERLVLKEEDISLCFLPLSHVFERLWSHYVMHRGAVNVFLQNPREVIDVLPKVQPTVMCTVPRFFDKTLTGIKTETAKWSPLKQKIFNWSVAIGHKTLPYISENKKLPAGLLVKSLIANKLVFSKLRNIFGGKIRYIPCAGAALEEETLKFFHAVGIMIKYGYGLTETTATVSCMRNDVWKYGPCGSVMPGVAVKIGEGNEILVKGKSVFHGYYKKEAETQAVMQEGWFKTGDEGHLDDKGFLTMTDRIKDLMKTSVGKYISPQKLELLLNKDEAVEQIIVVGDNRQYVTALVVPILDELKKLAERHKIQYSHEESLLQSPKILEVLKQRFEKLQEELASYERVVHFKLLETPFSIEQGTMTSTLKLRRRNIENRYKDLIAGMYS